MSTIFFTSYYIRAIYLFDFILPEFVARRRLSTPNFQRLACDHRIGGDRVCFGVDHENENKVPLIMPKMNLYMFQNEPLS